MKPRAIEKASLHLELALAATQRLDLSDGFKSFYIAWSEFLAQASRFYSALEQGSKGCGASEPWFGGKKHERKLDEVLAYIHHARNSDEHGLQHVVHEAGGAVAGRFDDDGFVDVRAKVTQDAFGNFQWSEPVAFNSVGQALSTALVAPRVVLATVVDRSVSYQPPTRHLGGLVDDPSPLAVAGLAIGYLTVFLREAQSLPVH